MATNTTSTTVADVTMFEIVHRGMRRDSVRFAALVATLDARSTRRAAAALRWLRGFRAELHEHHTVEDNVFYPALMARVPTVAEPLARVDADHHRLDVVLADLDRNLDAVARGDAVPATCAAAARAADDLAELIAVHLDFEDVDLVPLFIRHFTAAEYDELTAQAMKNGKLGDLAFAVPWIVDHATPDERERLLAEAPLPMRLLWRATRRRYARVVDAAFADVPVPTTPAGAGVAHP